MSQDSAAILTALVLTAMVMISFWRQLLILMLSLFIAVFCFGLIYIVEIVRR